MMDLINKAVIKNISVIIPSLTLIIAGLTFYLNFVKTDGITLNVERTNATLLTRPMNIDYLTVTYLYNDSIPVEKLWQTVYLIKNTGKKTIFGNGFQEKSIREDSLTLKIDNYQNLLACYISNQNNGANLNGDKLWFSQWKHNEYVEITIISEGDTAASLNISDRDIANSIITYSQPTTARGSRTRIIDKLSSNAGRWISIA